MATLPVHRLDAATYGRFVATGELDGEPTELLEGVICEMSPHAPAHATAIMRLTRYLGPARAWLRIQLSLHVAGDSVPEPDLALVAEEPKSSEHPTTALFVVEVAVNSHPVDREIKAPLYAAAGIPIYWLIDIPGRAVEVRTGPTEDGYGRLDSYAPGASVPSPAAGVGPLDVTWLLA
ncbi:MAG: Uma2 family endonuclease [Solirubrobacteraceae bacterium]